MDSTKPQAIPTDTPNPGHETRDVNLRLIVISVVGLSILIIIVLVVIWGVLAFLANQEAGRIIPLPPLAESQVPPEPRLQASPQEDLDILRAEDDAILNSYGWVNKEAEVIHIPIDQAIDMTLERGLPVHSE